MRRERVCEKISERVNDEVEFIVTDVDNPVLAEKLTNLIDVTALDVDGYKVDFQSCTSGERYAQYKYGIIFTRSRKKYGLICWLETDGPARGVGLARLIRLSMLDDMDFCERIYTRVDNPAVKSIAIEQGFKYAEFSGHGGNWYQMDPNKYTIRTRE